MSEQEPEGMVQETRIPLNGAETAMVEQIAQEHGEPITVTRRDPGESGPLLVHAGDTTYELDETGQVVS